MVQEASATQVSWLCMILTKTKSARQNIQPTTIRKTLTSKANNNNNNNNSRRRTKYIRVELSQSCEDLSLLKTLGLQNPRRVMFSIYRNVRRRCPGGMRKVQWRHNTPPCLEIS